jgi:hypothetical protein
MTFGVFWSGRRKEGDFLMALSLGRVETVDGYLIFCARGKTVFALEESSHVLHVLIFEFEFMFASI